MATFSNFVFDVSVENPPQLGPSLSGSNNQVILNSGGTYGGKTIAGLLYNEISGLSTSMVSLSVVSGITFKVDTKYHGSTFALYFADRSSTLFTVNTAVANHYVTSDVTFDNRGPNERRRFAVEF
jgi:hypothetical protein